MESEETVKTLEMIGEKTTNLDQDSKGQNEQNVNDHGKETGQTKDSSTEHELTDNKTDKLINSEGESKKNKNDENCDQNDTEQSQEIVEIEAQKEQNVDSISANILFKNELETRVSNVNKNSESSFGYETNFTVKTSENSKTTKREENEMEIEEANEKGENNTELKTELDSNFTLSDIMIKTIETGKETENRKGETQHYVEENGSARETGNDSGDNDMEQGNGKLGKSVEIKHELNNTENIVKTRDITEIDQHKQNSGVNDHSTLINMMINTSETVESGLNDTTRMIEMNRYVSKKEFTNETVVKNTVVVSKANVITKGSNENYGTDGDKIDVSPDIGDTQYGKSTTKKTKDVRFSLPDVLVNMEDIRPSQQSLSLDELAGNNSKAAMEPKYISKTNNLEIGAHNEMHGQKTENYDLTEPDENSNRNGFNELLRGFYKTRDLIKREISYTKEWDKEEQSLEEEVSEIPDTASEVSKKDAENIEHKNSSINIESNIVTVTSVLLDNDNMSVNQTSNAFEGYRNVQTYFGGSEAESKVPAGNETVSTAFARNENLGSTSENVPTVFSDNETSSIGIEENETVSTVFARCKAVSTVFANNEVDLATFARSETVPTTFERNPDVLTGQEENMSSAVANLTPFVNVENDEAASLVTQATLMVDGEKSYVNCIRIKNDNSQSTLDEERGQDDLQEILIADPVFSAKSFLHKETQTENDIKGFIMRPLFDQNVSSSRSNLIISKTKTDTPNVIERTLPAVPFQHIGRKINENVQDWFHRNDTTQLSTLTLRGHYSDISYIDEPYYINRSWQKENDTSLPYYPFFEGEILRNTYGIDTKSLSRKIYLPTTGERYKKVNTRSSWANSKSTWVKRLYTHPNHHRYLSKYHGKYDNKKSVQSYPGSICNGYQQSTGRYLLASSGFIPIIPEIEKDGGCIHRNKCIWPLLAVISALMILVLVSVIVIILIV